MTAAQAACVSRRAKKKPTLRYQQFADNLRRYGITGPDFTAIRHKLIIAGTVTDIDGSSDISTDPH